VERAARSFDWLLVRTQGLWYPDFKHMMQRYRGKDVWQKRSAANTLLGSDDGQYTSSSSASQQQAPQPTQLTWTQTTAERLSAELIRLQHQHVVYLGGAVAVSEWSDTLREAMVGFGACARTEFNIEDDVYQGLLQS